MRAIMLAAGIGSRLYGHDDRHPHKALLRFAGRSLLQRHIDILRAADVTELVLVVGYHAEEVLAEIDRLDAFDFVRPVYNPEFRRGSLLSLWKARAMLAGPADVLFMDADVLYHPSLIERLCSARHDSCFLYDRDFEPGDEPVKLCIRDGHAVEFRKQVGDIAYDHAGEWPGFLRLSPPVAARLVEAMRRYVEAGRLDEPMEEAVRDVLLGSPKGTFGCEDVTGLPWIEIDFPEDVARARDEILPRLDPG